jgi:hypothetical protein
MTVRPPQQGHGGRWSASAVRSASSCSAGGSRPAGGTLVEPYLASRGLHLPPPWTLRFHAGLKHPSGGIWPAMVALVRCVVDGAPLAIQRTFLARNGAGKAPVAPQKMMLGPCRGGAVLLAAPGDVLMVGGGIETCLAAMLATGNPVWAALSTSGLRTLDLPNACAMSSCWLMATIPARRRSVTAPYGGSARAGASASPVRRRGSILTTCFWCAAQSAYHERRREWRCRRASSLVRALRDARGALLFATWTSHPSIESRGGHLTGHPVLNVGKGPVPDVA